MTDTINILLIEDTDTDAEIVRRALRHIAGKTFNIRRAKTMGQAETLLYNDIDIDIILLDLGLPDTAGNMDSFQRLECTKKSAIPTVVLTSVNDREMAIDMVNEGAEDYVRKSRLSHNPETLYDAIEFALRRHQNVLLLQEKKEKTIAEKEQVIHYMGGGYSCM